MICQTVWCLLSSASQPVQRSPWLQLLGLAALWVESCLVRAPRNLLRSGFAMWMSHLGSLGFTISSWLSYTGEGQKCKKMLSGTGRLLSSQRCWVRLGTAWSHREPREFAVPDGPQTWLLVYKEKLGLWSLRGEQFSGSQNSHLSSR